MRTAASFGARSRMASPSGKGSWILAVLVSINAAACAALSFGGESSNSGGSGGSGAWGGSSATGGTIDFDASTGTGGGSARDYAHLCGRGACDPSEASAVSTCEGSGAAGSGGAAAGGTGGMSSGGTGSGGAEAGGAGSGGVGGVGAGSVGSGGAGSGAGGAGSGAGGAGSGTGGAGSGAGGAGSGTGGAEGGAGGAGSGTGGAEGGAGGAGSGTGGAGSGTGGAGSGTGGAGAGGGPAALVVECKVVLAGDAAERTCVPAGAYPELSPCNTAADCGPGLGCVAVSAQGSVCREYCCGDLEACPQHTYCAPRPMAEAGATGVEIPVCVDADDCTLLEEGQCLEGFMCAVVRADGTTACVPIGDGRQGDECPCAPGFACSKLVNECRQICHTEPQASGSECEPGYECQGNSSLPEGFGLCVKTS